MKPIFVLKKLGRDVIRFMFLTGFICFLQTAFPSVKGLYASCAGQQQSLSKWV